jgi:hypothetical protein
VLAPAEHRRARLFVQRVALVNSGHAPIAAGDVVQGPLDHLGPHAEPLHAAGACSSQVVQAPGRDARAHLLVELALAFAPAADRGENDMILLNSKTGGVEVYDLANNQVTGAAFMGTVGLNWQFSGVGNFSGLGESDMLLRDSISGGLEVYDINNNQITNAAFIGTVGLDWQFSGVGNFSGAPGETDLLLRNSKTGGMEVYDIINNQITGAAFLGTVGLDWQFAGIGPVHGAGESDLVLRNKNSGAFEVYDITGNSLVGAASLGCGRLGLATRRLRG